ncbi:MAG: hypothetical protein U7123_25415 [Potamolinea sp.]
MVRPQAIALVYSSQMAISKESHWTYKNFFLPNESNYFFVKKY